MSRVEIVTGDITTLEVDAIVNAANATLAGGGGVDGAIHRAAGPELAREASRHATLPAGDAVVTAGYSLPARHVIHTVGPVWRGGEESEDELLASCYRRCFELAREWGLRSIAFPAISTGAFGFPRERAAKVALIEVKHELERSEQLQRIVLVLFDEAHASLYRRMAAQVLPGAPGP